MALQHRVINPILTTHAKAVVKQSSFVGEALMPTIFVPQYGGQVLQYGDEMFYQVDDIRTPGAHTARIESIEYTGVDFALKNHSLEGKVPREHQIDARQGPGIDLQRAAVTVAVNRMALNREIEVATAVSNVAGYPAGNSITLAGTAQWDEATTGGDPFGVIADAMEVVRSKIGVRPNVAVMNAKVLKGLKNNQQIRENFKYTSAQSITQDMLQGYLDVSKIVVGQAVWRNPATGLLVDVWGNNLILAYVAPGQAGNSLAMAEPSYAYTYTYTGMPIVEPAYYDDNRKTWFYPATWDRTSVISAANAAYIVIDAVAG